MRRVRGELAHLLLRAEPRTERVLNAVQHRVDGGAEPADLGLVIGIRHPRGQVAARGDLVGGPGHLVQRDQAAADKPLAAKCQQGDQCGAGDELRDDEPAQLVGSGGERLADEQQRAPAENGPAGHGGRHPPAGDLNVAVDVERLAAERGELRAATADQQRPDPVKPALRDERLDRADAGAVQLPGDGRRQLPGQLALGQLHHAQLAAERNLDGRVPGQGPVRHRRLARQCRRQRLDVPVDGGSLPVHPPGQQVGADRAHDQQQDRRHPDQHDEHASPQRQLPDPAHLRRSLTVVRPLRTQAVADPPLGVNQRRPERVKLAAQVADRGFDDLRLARIVPAPDVLQ